MCFLQLSSLADPQFYIPLWLVLVSLQQQYHLRRKQWGSSYPSGNHTEKPPLLCVFSEWCRKIRYNYIPSKSKTKQSMVFRMIHAKDSLLLGGKFWSLDFLGIAGKESQFGGTFRCSPTRQQLFPRVRISFPDGWRAWPKPFELCWDYLKSFQSSSVGSRNHLSFSVG